MSKQKRNVEWSFDFEDIGNRVSEFFSDVIGGDVEVKTAELEAPLDGATSSSVKVDFSVGRANVTALPAVTGNLFEANIAYVGEYEFEVTGEADRRVKLRQKGMFPRGFTGIWGNSEELIWNIALSQKVPHSLRLKGGVGEADIDLTNLTVEKLKLETGVGKVALTLPIQDRFMDVDINGGVGKTDVVIPAGFSGHIDIRGGVGAVDVMIAPDTAIRVEADSGLGGLSMPKGMERVKGSGNFMGMSGVWETPGFDTASKQVVIDYKGGVGSLKVKHFDVV